MKFKLIHNGIHVGDMEFYDDWGAIPTYNLYKPSVEDPKTQSVFAYPNREDEKILMDCKLELIEE